ncbi:nonribosomal peptide synthetase hasD [Aspergillus novofumigatus IBT 16806]|uniref:Nonribosomal peptide synthase GliP2 n=1 Tax=Aspergillus novofumigatus (strain IBT 16806) TaxID=1392255 RepID=A0A2I1BT60_ASPN1|nr:nonribosomal peptide synthase GliP2 [Aspergillus novofumigatus IBT 16806]PKX88542.1 nonribosomal peptide synthase GliP2 [Aspergillus novofumigatus IBT 16806]
MNLTITTTNITIQPPSTMARRAPTLLDHFYVQLQKHPSSVAIEDGTQSAEQGAWERITYAQLDALSDIWSKRLRLAGVGAGCIVPLLSKRSIAMVAATLAILKLRAAYVPIDIDSWGKDRIETVLKAVNPQIIVSTSPCPKDHYMYPVVALERNDFDETATSNGTHCTRKDEDSIDRGDDLAYIIFTSGTTGKPKGVKIGQRSISRYVKEGGDLPFNFNTEHGTRVLLICSIAFDVCAGVMFNTLCNGGTLVLADPSTFEAAAKTCHVLPLTPSILVTLDPKAGFDTVEKIFLGGESPSPSLIEAWSSPRRRLYNAYGPTETTCTAFMGELLPGSPITIGYPISYSTVILLDEDGLALGYFHDPDRTSSAFVEWNGVKIYKTGDYGKRTKHGLQFCGRRDSVVKNRGFLINLEADVEPALQSYDKVDSASAFMFQGQLIAFVTPISAKEGLREYLANTVSSFLVPDTIYSLDEFPTTGNGKVDRQSLMRMHQLEQGSDTARLERGLSAVEAVRRGLSHVLRLPESQILQVSSFPAVMLVSVLRRMGFGISVAEVLLLDAVQEIAAAATELNDIPPAFATQEDLIERLRHDISTTRPLDEGATIAPMTDMQTRMLGASVATPGLSFIKTSFTFDHPEKQDLTSTLHAAWVRLHRRHEILRTAFVLTASSGAQVISQDPGFSWEQKFVTESEWEVVCRSEEHLDVAEFANFDAESRASLSRVVLIIAPRKRTRFVWTVHHSLVDGWSMATLMRDFASCLDDKPMPAAPQFAQVAQAIGQLKAESSERAVSFWREYLGGYTPAQRFRVSPPSDVSDYTQAALSQRLTVSVSALEAAAKNRFAVTPATLLYAAWGLLISRYSGTDRAVLGAVLSGRSLPIPGVENIVGPLINTLPLAIDTQEALSTYTFVQSVFRRLCDISEFQWSPVALIQEGCGCNPAELFETLFALQYDFPQSPWESSKVPEPRDIRYEEATQVPLTVLLDSADGQFDVRFIYRRSHFGDAIVQRMICQFDNLLAALVTAQPDTNLSNVAGQMFNDREYETSIAKPEQPASAREVPESLVKAIENSIQAHPDICAVEGLTGHLTYREFGKMTEHISWRLSQHIQPGSVVCMISDGSLLWLLAMIAIVRAGAIYCPVDQKLPRDRKDYMVRNSRAALILYANSSQDPFCNGSIMQEISSSSGSPIATSRNRPSGSTGLPKAVQLQHKEGRLYSRPGQRNAQMLSLGFDCCIKEVFSTICFDPENPIAHLARVDATMATPSLLATLEPANYPNLKVITVAGEAVSQVLNDKWATGRILINGYGPAECTLISTTAILHPGNKVSIGKPLPGLACYLLDSNKHPVPVGVSGEIYISGVQVTPGYLHNEQETAKRFLGDLFNPGQVMYRTGDIGRMLENGNIEYIGREDNQIKLRGFRIDLGEVQSTISKLASEARNVALIVSNGNLIAFMTPETIDVKSLAKSLETQLPQYAVPNRIIALATLPTSANNKVDSSALQRYLRDQGKDGAVVEDLETDTQRALAAIWADVLGRDLNQMPISPSDRFFELGGHSLLQIKVAQAISKRWDIRPLPLKQVIRHHSLQDLSLAIDELVSDPTSTVSTTMPFLDMSPVARNDQLPLSYLEKEMLLNHLISGGSPAGNMNFVCKIRGDINAETLADAFQRVTADIEVFRTRYSVIDGMLFRQQAPGSVKVPRVVQTGNLSSFVHGRITKSFDLSTEPPVDVSIIIGTPMQAMLVVVMSHVVGDAATMATYLNRVSKTYELLRSNAQPTNSITVSDNLTYIDWAHWASTLQPNPRALTFWSSYLSNPPAPLTFANPSPAPATYIGLTRSWTLPSSMHRNLSNLAAKASVTMHQLILSAVFFTLQCPGTDSLPGLFLDRLLLRIQRSPHQSSLFDFLSSVRETSQQALAHIIPFHALRSSLAHKPSLIDPLFKVMVTYHTAADQRPLLDLPGAEVQPIPWRHTGGSKFPLTVEFTETAAQDLQVDMEYDLGCIREGIALRLEFALSFALQLMVLERETADIIQLVQMSFRPGEDSPVGLSPTHEGLAGLTNGTNKTDSTTGQQELEDILADAVCECLRLEAQAVDTDNMDALRLQHLCEKRGSISALAACAVMI